MKLERARREYASKIAAAASLRSRRLVDALAAVPREAFLGPGPWQIKRADETGRDYHTTPHDDPRHVYDNVLVALDAERNLNNGEPTFVLRCLDDLDLAPGDRFLHVGCGTGYYTAIAARAVVGGTVVGIEIDPGLAERARQNLRTWPGVAIEAVDGSEAIAESFDAILVNAGATEPLPVWLDHLLDAGRLLVPMTVDLPEPWAGIGAGQMLSFVARRKHTRHALSDRLQSFIVPAPEAPLGWAFCDKRFCEEATNTFAACGETSTTRIRHAGFTRTAFVWAPHPLRVDDAEGWGWWCTRSNASQTAWAADESKKPVSG